MSRWGGAQQLLAVLALLGACDVSEDAPADAPGVQPVAEVQQAEITQDNCNIGDESLPSYARSCADAMGGIDVPGFDCTKGVEVPDTQGDGLPYPDETCDRPNVLNGKCDPGSKFQVLVDKKNAKNQRVVMVAHCRHKGQATDKFSDVAVIAYNYSTGDTCFFQDKAPGSVNEPIAPAPKDDSTNAFWGTPAYTAGINCVGCHDNGPFVRSPYLTQLKGTPVTEASGMELQPIVLAQAAAAAKSPPAILPGSRDILWNSTQPYRFVGKNFQGWKAYAISLHKPGGASNQCTSCHRMGISSVESGGNVAFTPGYGTAQSFGLLATGKGAFAQEHKNPHVGSGAPLTSPIWMLPSQQSYSQASFDDAKAIQDCAKLIVAGKQLPPECGYAQYAQGNTCDGSGITVTVNGGTGSTPTNNPTTDVVDIPAGGKVAFGGWVTLHGPFIEASTNIPYGSAGFDGTFASLDVVNGAFQARAGWDGPPANPARAGAGGDLAFTRYEEIAGVPANPSCGYGGGTPLADLPATQFLSKVQVDTGLKFIDVPTTFIGNLSRINEKDFFGIKEVGANSELRRQISKVGAFQSEAFAYNCSGWTPTFSVLHKGTTGDTELIAAPNGKKHRCILTGISGNWATTAAGGTVQPYAQIYSSGTSIRLRVVPATGAPADVISAEASCIQIQP